MQPLQLDDIAALDLRVIEEPSGRPMELALDDIQEDPTQPRSEFFLETLQELADSIAARGVLQPVSVRRHREQSGSWVLNFGARRLRATRMAGKNTIPAFEDQGADSYDQVIENEQRERLKPLDLALFIQRRLALGESQADIARRMSKSRNYVMVASALIDAPDWLLTVYREGRCRSMNALHELRRLHAEQPGRVEAWAAGRDVISREMLQEARAMLENGAPAGGSDPSGLADVGMATPTPAAALVPYAPALDVGMPAAATKTVTHAQAAPTRTNEPQSKHRPSTPPADPLRCRLQAMLNGAPVWVLTDDAPNDSDKVFVQPIGQSSKTPVKAALLRLVGLRFE